VAHGAILAGFPDFLPQWEPAGPSVLEVTILAPRTVPAPAAQPEPPARAAEEPRPARQQPDRKAAQQPAAEPPVRPVPGAPPPTQDAEAAGSFSVGSSRGIAPLATVPDAAAEAVPQQVTPPSFDAAYLNNPEPPYPPAAVRAGQQGTVMLRVMVKRDGLPSRVEIAKSSGHRVLDTAAQDQVWSWRFAPARLGTEPIESWVVVPVVFRLRDPR
jgi:protein TonB